MRTLTALLLLAACGPATGPAADSSGFVRNRPSDKRSVPANLIPVPLVRQKTDYSCGDASTLALLRYWHNPDWREVGETSLYDTLQTTKKDGTDPQPIAAFLNGDGLGFDAAYRTEDDDGIELADLLAAVDAGNPPIVDLQAWQSADSRDTLKPWRTDWDDGHYVVLAGYDDVNLFFMDPSTSRAYAYIPRDEFPDRWHDTVGADNARRQHMVITVQPHDPSLAPYTGETIPPNAYRMF
jgi:predicted double-glycine peptidase